MYFEKLKVAKFLEDYKSYRFKDAQIFVHLDDTLINVRGEFVRRKEFTYQTRLTGVYSTEDLGVLGKKAWNDHVGYLVVVNSLSHYAVAEDSAVEEVRCTVGEGYKFMWLKDHVTGDLLYHRKSSPIGLHELVSREVEAEQRLQLFKYKFE